MPIAWSETLDGLKQGLIDGAETWSGAAAWANMAPVVSQDVQLNFFAGTQATSMRSQSFEALSPTLKDAVLESAYTTQLWVQGHHEAALNQIVGATNPQLPDTIYAQNGVRVADLSPEALKEAEEMCSPKHHPKEWELWRDRLNKWVWWTGRLYRYLCHCPRSSKWNEGPCDRRRAASLVERLNQ